MPSSMRPRWSRAASSWRRTPPPPSPMRRACAGSTIASATWSRSGNGRVRPEDAGRVRRLRRAHQAVPGLPPRAHAARHRARSDRGARMGRQREKPRACAPPSTRTSRPSPGSIPSAPSTSMPRSSRASTPTAWLLSLIAAVRGAAGGGGRLIIRRNVAQPLARITRITEAVAAGGHERAVPYRRAPRRDRRARPLDRGVPGRHAQERRAQPHRHRRRPDPRPPPGADGGTRSASSAPTSRPRSAELGRISDRHAVGLGPARRRRRQRRGPDRGRRHRLGARRPRTCATSRPPPTSLPPR